VDGAKVRAAKAMYEQRTWSTQEICTTLGISRATRYRYVGKA